MIDELEKIREKRGKRKLKITSFLLVKLLQKDKKKCGKHPTDSGEFNC